MLAGFGISTLFFFFWSINIPESSEHTICFNNMVGLQIMNLRKDGETIQITSQSEDILMSVVLLLLGFPVIVYKLSNLYFHRKGVFKKLNIHAFSVKQNGLPKDAKGNRCSFISIQTGGKRRIIFRMIPQTSWARLGTISTEPNCKVCPVTVI